MVHPLQTHILAWAEQQDDLRAVILVGSYARQDHPADEWADLDLILFARDIHRYATTDDWPEALGGEQWVIVPFERGDGIPEYLILFDGGLKVDLAFYPLDEIQRFAAADPLPGWLQRGYRLLLDKDGIMLPSSPFTAPVPPRPSAEAFRAVVNTFWYRVYHVGIALRRGDLWRAKLRDHALKEALLTMLEWHARATRGWETDTWMEGRFLAEWTDPDTWAALHEVYGHFDAADSWRALWAAVALFRRLAQETAGQLGFTYPAALDAQISAFVRTLDDTVG
jgi:aminoglycoside 6-adenylyltransferase